MATNIDTQPRVYHAPADWTLPDLGRKAVPPGARVDTVNEDVAWTSYDTPGRDLHRFGASLSRRGADEWRLRADGVVTTVRQAGSTVPEPLRELLTGLRAGGALRRVDAASGRLVTRVVVDEAGEVLGELDDLRYVQDDGEVVRRLDVTVVDPAFGRAVDARLRKAGATPGDGPDRPAGAAARTVADAVGAFLREQRTAVLRGDLRLRRDPAATDAVHPTRVAVRRLRSALRLIPVFDPDAALALDLELRWMSGVLGDVRDLDVLRTHLDATVRRVRDAEGDAVPQAALDAAGEAAQAALRERLATNRARLAATLRGRRYLALLRTLRAWEDEPPLSAAADAPVKELARYGDAAVRRMRKRAKQAQDTESTHRARKAAKRARYVNELAAAHLSGKAAARCAQAAATAKARQTELGDRQDAAMAAQFLAGLAGRRDLPAQAAFAAGVLWTAERAAQG